MPLYKANLVTTYKRSTVYDRIPLLLSQNTISKHLKAKAYLGSFEEMFI